MTRAKYYVGVKPYRSGLYHCDIFTSATPVTNESHGNKYLFCFGAYNTKRTALQVAMFQNYVIDNPESNGKCKHDYR